MCVYIYKYVLMYIITHPAHRRVSSDLSGLEVYESRAGRRSGDVARPLPAPNLPLHTNMCIHIYIYIYMYVYIYIYT